jgi:hypothetical protein
MKRVHGLQDDRSDRFIAKGSGTDPAKGNTPKAVAQFLRDKGASSEGEWPSKDIKDLDEYYGEIPHSVFDLANMWRQKYNFGYERVHPDIDTMKEALKYSPLGISTSLMPRQDGSYYKPEGWRDGHWLVLLRIRDDGKFVLLDSYDPFIKIADPFAPEVAMRYALDYERYSLLVQAAAIAKGIVQALLRSVGLPADTPVKPRETPVPEEKPVQPEPATDRLRKEALRWIGRDASPLNLAPQELACAESICTVIASSIIPGFPRDITSTATLATFLDGSKHFQRITFPKPGCIIISPRTGTVNGHAGIFLTDKRIASNDSKRGTFEDNYTFDSWISSFKKGRGLRILIWQPK